jgi:serine/threonine protein kinase/Tfp pilus assembly protein PilF
MKCPKCNTENPEKSARCSACNTPLEGATVIVATMTPPGAVLPNDATILSGPPDSTSTVLETTKTPKPTGIASGWSKPLSTQAAVFAGASISNLQPGATLGNRYEIVALLGEGGMGAVYKARDVELDRLVALKVIRPELAGQPEILQRFKQELILARKVTHRNVVRIFDLGEADGIKFITMEFIDGHDLKSMLVKDGKLPVDRVVDVIQQVCLALEAAHGAGVVHRDLKPQNIMVDQQGRVAVMDFGIARSLELGGMTQTGALIGTPEYMSPEQVRGEHVDARSDLFTLGIICCEVLSGKLPYQADTAMASMFMRTKERAIPVDRLDRSIPPFFGSVVAKCLELDPKDRFQSAREMFDALESWKSGSAAPIRVRSRRWTQKLLRKKFLIVSASAVVLLAGALILLRDKLPFHFSSAPAAVPVRSLAVLPFRNASGDSSLDWLGQSLAAMLTTDVGQSAHFRSVPTDRVDQILHDLRITPSTDLDQATLKRVADFSNADTLVWGQFTKIGDQVRIDATLRDPSRPTPMSLKATAPNANEILGAVSQLAESLRQNLSLSSGVLNELRSGAFKPSSQSVQALRFYNEGLEFARQANPTEAAKKFEAAVQADQNFALAFAMLASADSRLGGQDNQDNAEQMARRALSLSENLSPEERDRIQAISAQVTGDTRKAIDAYANLAKVFPNDADIHFELGGLYERTNSLEPAQTEFAKVLALDPKYVNALLGAGRIQIKLGNPQPALDILSRALLLAGDIENQRAKGDALQGMGVAYKIMNRLDDALNYYNQALEIRRASGNNIGVASTLGEIAQVQNRQKNSAEALKNYQGALQIQRQISDKRGTANTLINLGTLYESQAKAGDAMKSYKEALEIERDLGDENLQALCMNNIGNILLTEAQFSDALIYFQNSLQLREHTKVPGDLAQTYHNLGETASRLGNYDQATDDYLKALDFWRTAGNQRGAAITSYNLGSVFEAQGRYAATLNSNTDALKIFRDLHDQSDWMAIILNGYGISLAEVGRFDEAQKTLQEASQLAGSLQNKALIARTLNNQGDVAVFQGNFAEALPIFEQASAQASGTTDRRIILLSKLNIARTEVLDGKGQASIASLRALAKEADGMGLKNVTAECSLYVGQALLAGHQTEEARKELLAVLRVSEKLGFRTLAAQSNALLARAALTSNNAAEASRYQAEAQRICDEIFKEANTDSIRKRKDLAAISAPQK